MAKHNHPKKRSGCAGIFLALALLFIVGGIYFHWENNAIQTTEHVYLSDMLPAEFDGLRIAQLSDLHGKEFGENSSTLLQAVTNAQPDIIVITGDLIDQYSQYAMLPPLMEGLAAIAPTYYVTGNHEWAVQHVKELKTLLRESGVRVLSNEFELWQRGEYTRAIAGVDDPNGLADQKTPAQLREEIDADFTILLSHRDTVEEYCSWGYHLVFCGHGHGGIFRIPVLDRGLLSTDRTFFPEYDGGLYALSEDFSCCVSRGLGSNTVPFKTFRLFNRPELPVVTLRST